MIKKWLLNLSFIQIALKEAERQGGINAFPLAQKDILETMRDDLDKQAKELAKQKLHDLLSIVDESLVVAVNKFGIVYIGGKQADKGRLANLKAEADFLMESDIWKILNQTPRELAQRAMFIDGDSIDTMKKGRSMLYLLKNQETIVNTFRSYTQAPLAP